MKNILGKILAYLFGTLSLVLCLAYIASPSFAQSVDDFTVNLFYLDSSGAYLPTMTTPDLGSASNPFGNIYGTVSGVLSDVVDDTSPQLGGDLDLNSHDITGTGNVDITGDVASDTITIGEALSYPAEVLNIGSTSTGGTTDQNSIEATMETPASGWNWLNTLGIYAESESGNANDIDGITGTINYADHNGTGTATYVTALSSYARNISSGDISLASALYGGVQADDGTIDDARGSEVQILLSGTDPVITNAYGFIANDVYDGSDSGSLTSLAGMAISDFTIGTNKTQLLLGTTTIPSGDYAIYSASNKDSYFDGDIDLNGNDILNVGDLSVGTATISTYASVAGYIEFDPSPASDDSGSGITSSVTVDTNAFGVGACLYMASDGHYDTTDADATSTMPCSAMALETSTGTKDVLNYGYIRNDGWNWGTVGGLLYVSTTTGALTQTAPSGASDVVQIVGYAISDDEIMFMPNLITSVIAS